jgi:hypothetical protein
VIELVESPKWPMVQGEKSDPPVGTGRELKQCAKIAAERGRSEIPGGLVFCCGQFCGLFFVMIF